MAIEIITKRCCNCKQIKSLSEFHKNRRTKDGRQTTCKSCKKSYDQRPERKAYFKAYEKKYQQSEHGKAIRRNCEQSPKCRAYRKRYQNSSYAHHPNYRKARSKVSHLVKTSKLPRPDTLLCHYCQKPARQYHHYLGYKPEHWLDVVPACQPCDIKAHKMLA